MKTELNVYTQFFHIKYINYKTMELKKNTRRLITILILV